MKRIVQCAWVFAFLSFPFLWAQLPGINSIVPGTRFVICEGDTVLFHLKAYHSVDSVVWQDGFPPTWTISADSIDLIAYSGTVVYVLGYLSGYRGAVDTDTVVIEVFRGGFLLSDTSVCEGQSIVVTYTGSDSAAAFVWHFGTGASPSQSFSKGPHSVYWVVPGPKQITLEVYYKTCADTVQQTLMVYPPLQVDAGPDLIYCKPSTGVQLQGNAIGGGGNCTIQWSPASGLTNPTILNPMAFPDTTTTYVLTVSCDACGTVSDTMTVYVDRRPLVSVIPKLHKVCITNTSTQLNGVVTGGAPPYQYFWFPTFGLMNPYTANPTVIPTVDTTYYFYVIDSMGCASDTASVFVDVFPRPIVDAGPDLYLCSNQPGDTIKATVLNYLPGQLEYLWTPSVGLNNPTLLQPYTSTDTTITYQLIAWEPVTQCSSYVDSSAIVTVYIKQAPVADAGPWDSVTICLGDTVVIGGNPSGGDPLGYLYQWSPSYGLSSTTVRRPEAFPSFTTTYFVQVYSNGCWSDADSVTVQVLPYPQIALDPIPTACEGDSIRVSAQLQVPGGIQHVTISWSPAQYVSDPTILEPYLIPPYNLWYYLTVSYNGKCAVTDSVYVSLYSRPNLTIFPEDTAICSGDTVRIPVIQDDAEPIFFTWSPTTYMLNPNTLTPLVFPPTSQEYVLHVYYGGGYKCVFSDTFYVSVSPSLSITFLPFADTVRVCQGDTLTVTAAGGVGGYYLYWIYNRDTLQQGFANQIAFVPDSSGDLLLVGQQGICTDSRSLFVEVRHRPPQIPFFLSQSRLCLSDTLHCFNLNPDATYLFVWDFGDGTVSNEMHPQHHYSLPGTYVIQLHAINDSGCRTKEPYIQRVTVYPTPVARFTIIPDQDTFYLPSTVTIQDQSTGAIQSRLWILDLQELNFNASRFCYKWEQAGKRTLLLYVTDSAGCRDSVSRIVWVLEPQLAVPNVFTPNADGYNDFFSLPYDGIETYQLTIFDRYGVKVFESSSPLVQWDGTKDGEPLPEGAYFYVAKIGEKLFKGQVTLIR
jgi:gliding motility-associated-like protein